MTNARTLFVSVLSLLALSGSSACGGGASQSDPTTGPTVRVTPSATEILPAASKQFLSAVSGLSDPGVVWEIVEQGGGTISTSGLYTAPAATGTFHVRASARTSPSVQGTATVTVTLTPTAVPMVGGCPVFTADDAWNIDVSSAPTSTSYTTLVRNMVGSIKLHPDFGGEYGIPFNVVPQTQPLLPMSFGYDDQSDPGPYPFPGASSVKIEGNDPTCAAEGDCHVLAVQQGSCKLYEGWACKTSGGGWNCGSGAVFDMTRNSQGQRPDGWTSADAAGLSILAGLIRYEEVAVDREIKHAIRFTLRCTRAQYVPPASHYAVPGGCDSSSSPPMGLRVRLAASYDTSRFSADTQIVLRAMKKYGMILADNGSNFYFQGEEDARWSDTLISELKSIPASAFEALAP